MSLAVPETYLDLCQRLCLECAISGTMTTAENQTGEFQRVAVWIQQAWSELQNERQNWTFMRSSYLLRSASRPDEGVSFATVTGQAVYPLGTGAGTVGVEADNFMDWIPTSFRNNTTGNGGQDEIFLDWVSYDTWRDAYAFGAQRQVQTRNVAIAVGPDNSICLGPYPINLYTLTGDYYRAPSTLVNDDDTPLYLPKQFMMAIVYKAMRDSYGGYENAADVIARGARGYRGMLRQLSNLRGGIITAGRTLA